QWTFRKMERSHPDLLALVKRRTGAILEMDWDIRLRIADCGLRNEDSDPAANPQSTIRNPQSEMAAQQAAALREAYERIDNLYEAIGHLALAAFRGFAHLQKHTSLAPRGTSGERVGERGAYVVATTPDAITHLEPVNQWNLLRNGSGPEWRYNPKAFELTYGGAPLESELDPADFIILQDEQPIDYYALPCFVRANLGEKDWSSFLEIYGIPSGVVTMPPSVPSGKEDEYAEKAKEIAEGASGALPFGATYTPNDGPRGVSPFRAYLDYFTEKLVLVGTGGLLTMLAQSGSGTLAGGAHSDTFRTLAKAQARQISGAVQRQFDDPLLDALFPGQPHLAYFELNSAAETSSSAVLDDAVKAKQAGFTMDPSELSEKTGYQLQAAGFSPEAAGTQPSLQPPASSLQPATELAAIRNRLSALRKAVADGEPQISQMAQIQTASSVKSVSSVAETAFA
ncbi:MAG: DUF935 family protein, partial [Verrucomicrobia bacterium]|nr:DUF935 family protein [Verrucomicrobiota bacterium]